MTRQTHLGSNKAGKIVVLAPANAMAERQFRAMTISSSKHQTLLHEMQRLRANVYLQDGAITPNELTRDGRHVQDIDESSWHLLTVDGEGAVTGCARYTEYAPGVAFDRLRVAHSALAQSDVWGGKLARAVGSDARQARTENRAYVEVGGWALLMARRSTSEALRLAIGGFALGQLLGGCIGLATATVRNNSSSILRRLGGESLEDDGTQLPAYFDPQYGCEMEILRFHSDRLNPKFTPWLAEVRAELACAQVVAPPSDSIFGNTFEAAWDRLSTVQQPQSERAS